MLQLHFYTGTIGKTTKSAKDWNHSPCCEWRVKNLAKGGNQFFADRNWETPASTRNRSSYKRDFFYY